MRVRIEFIRYLILVSEKSRIYNKHLLQVRSLFILLVFTAVLSYPRLSNAEGTKQTCPFAADTNYLTLLYPIFDHPNYPPFATANSGEAGRLYIHIQNSGETIWFGFAVQSGAKAAAYTYTLFDPSGNIVKSGTVSGTQQGYIKHYLQAVAGPSALATGGYNALSYTTTNTGDYYIEFSPPYNGSLQLKYYDITVSGPGNTPIKGRLWSKRWMFNVEAQFNIFKGSFYTYTDDQLVTRMSFDSLQPLIFCVCCNSSGCTNTGNFLQDRCSVPYSSIYGQYKIFLNEPDPVSYPTGAINGVSSFSANPTCNGTVTFNFTVGSNCIADLLINVNSPPGYNPVDITMVKSLTPGFNTFTWDGIDGMGNAVPNGTHVEITGTVSNGLTNFPMFDVEILGGIDITQIRPTGPKPALFWVDTLLYGGNGQFNLDGCTAPDTSCHRTNLGNANTLNTWWYALSQTLTPTSFLMHRSWNLQLSHSICDGDSLWLAGAWRKTAGNYISGAPSILTGCDSTRMDLLTINLQPHVNLGPDLSRCAGESVTLDAGAGPGFSYQWNTGATSRTLVVNTTGSYSVIVSTPNGCNDSDQLFFTSQPLPGNTLIKHN